MTEDRLADVGARLLSRLLVTVGSTPHSYWGLAEHPDHTDRISRATAQLIEAVSWLDCQEEAFPRLESLARFLTQQPATDPDRIAANASRLKSILQYCAYEHSPFCEYDAMAGSLNHFAGLDLTTPSTALYDRLCVTDLFGYFLSLSETASYTRGLNIANLRTRINDRYALLLTAVQNSQASIAALDPKSYSFAIWTLLLGSRYGPMATALVDPSLQADLVTLQRYSAAYDQEYQVSKPYNPAYYTQIVYPKLILAWHARKTGRLAPYNAFVPWFLTTVEHFLADDESDPFHLGLALKFCIAASKETLRQRFRQMNLEVSLATARAAATRDAEVTNSLLGQIIRDRVTVTVDKADRLTGGWSAAHVWRATGHYSIPMRTADRTPPPEPFAFVVKTGPREWFSRAAVLYNELSPEGQKLFPRHDPRPSVISTPAGPTFYLIMEELRDFESIGKRLLRLLPVDATAATPGEHVRAAVEEGLEAITRLHSLGKTEGIWTDIRPRLGQIKIAGMFETLEDIRRNRSTLRQLCGSDSQVVSRGAAAYHIKNPNDLISKALNLVGKIVIRGRDARQRLSITHGDCHAHNIMVPRGQALGPLFVDIDGLCIEDYLEDYAQFIAHVCFSLDLERIPDDGVPVSFAALAGTPAIESNFGPEHERIWGIQRDIFEQCRTRTLLEANQRGDTGATIRLYALIARRLLFVASKSHSNGKATALLFRACGFLQAVVTLVGKPEESVAIPLSRVVLNLAQGA